MLATMTVGLDLIRLRRLLARRTLPPPCTGRWGPAGRLCRVARPAACDAGPHGCHGTGAGARAGGA
ncbi:hypothetical protein RAA17_01045 [Komagataeibacter rhaeticus]|nr:hypothetical protein [Komagataeibacter rhaeticus]